MSVNHPNEISKRDNSLSDVDSFMNELTSGLGQKKQKSHPSGGQKDDMDKLDILLKKLLQSKKITKSQLIQKLMNVSD